MKSTKRLSSDMVEKVMTQGRAVKSASFLFKFIENYDNKPINKAIFGFISSKKVFTKAVDRNRARRRGRAALYKIIGRKSTAKPVFGAFVLGKQVNTMDLNDLVLEIQQVLIKSGILVKL